MNSSKELQDLNRYHYELKKVDFDLTFHTGLLND